MKQFLSGLFLVFAALFVPAAPAMAQGADGAAPIRSTHIKAALISESDHVAPGQRVTLALRMTPGAGWHGYWQNPGDAGLGMTVDWRLPDGAVMGPLSYPTPETLTVQGIMNYVYEGEYAVLVDMTVPDGLAPGTRLQVAAHLEWLACTDKICVPEQGDVAAELTVGQADGARKAMFDRWRQKLPVPLDGPATFAVKGKRLSLLIPYPAAAALADPYFFPATDGLVDYGAAQRFSRRGDRLLIETGARGTGDVLEGILRIGPGDGLWVRAAAGKVEAKGFVPLAEGAGGLDGGSGEGPIKGAGGMALAFLGALLGGLILNIMPCVFPILGLKALSLAKSTVGEGAARRDALAYTMGAVFTCLALGGLLLALRAGGEQIGWAFQLQDPRIVAGLLLLMVVITANLAGLFELPALTFGSFNLPSGGFGGSFGTGALAAFVATPCTGPFMAAALGAALILPVPVALLLFAGLGLGLALPFLAIGFVPALRRRLPRPGPWLHHFRKVMAVPMGLTALALGWLLWRMAGLTPLLLLGAVGLLLLLLLGWAGIRQRRGRDGLFAPMAGGLVSAAVAVALVPAGAPDAAAPARATVPGGLAAEPFDKARLAALRAEGRPVFAYFTADWCLTCKANEIAAIERAETIAHFRRADMAVLRGDYTRRDAEIARFLADHGRSGVPFYLYYPPGQPPRILPQILTIDMLTALAG